MSNKPATNDERPTNVRWLIFALACGTSFFLYLHRYTWNIVGPEIQRTFQFDNATSGFVFSFFYWTYASGQIPSGVAMDWFGPHIFLAISILLWSATLPLFGTTSRLWVVGLYRLLFGAGQAGCYPGLNKATRLWFPLRYRTTIQGIVAASGRAGGAVSSILLGTVLMGYWGLSWQVSLAVLGAGGVAFALAFALLFRNSPDEHPLANEAEAALVQGVEPAATEKSVLPWREASKNFSMRIFVCQQFLDAGSDVVFVSLIGKYFLECYVLDIKQVGWLASLPLWGGMVGGIFGGWLNDAMIGLTGNRRWSRSGIGAGGKFLGAIALILLAMQPAPLVAGLFLFVAKFFSDWSQPTTWGCCTDIGGRYSATVFSIINTAGTSGGMVMPIVFGLVLDAFTRSQGAGQDLVKVIDWGPLFYVLTAMYAGSGVCWLLLDCTRTLDKPVASVKPFAT